MERKDSSSPQAVVEVRKRGQTGEWYFGRYALFPLDEAHAFVRFLKEEERDGRLFVVVLASPQPKSS